MFGNRQADSDKSNIWKCCDGPGGKNCMDFTDISVIRYFQHTENDADIKQSLQWDNKQANVAAFYPQDSVDTRENGTVSSAWRLGDWR